MDSEKSENDKELTSTMGNVLSMTKNDEKNDTSDATPTSSTDANTTLTSAQIVSDDPISSTSSDVVDPVQPKQDNSKMFDGDKRTLEQEADLLDISMSNVSSEKITEDVEDLVQDLENLLGESLELVVRKQSVKEKEEDNGTVQISTEISEEGECLKQNEEQPESHIQETNVDQSSDSKNDNKEVLVDSTHAVASDLEIAVTEDLKEKVIETENVTSTEVKMEVETGTEIIGETSNIENVNKDQEMEVNHDLIDEIPKEVKETKEESDDVEIVIVKDTNFISAEPPAETKVVIENQDVSWDTKMEIVQDNTKELELPQVTVEAALPELNTSLKEKDEISQEPESIEIEENESSAPKEICEVLDVNQEGVQEKESIPEDVEEIQILNQEEVKITNEIPQDIKSEEITEIRQETESLKIAEEKQGEIQSLEILPEPEPLKVDESPEETEPSTIIEQDVNEISQEVEPLKVDESSEETEPSTIVEQDVNEISQEVEPLKIDVIEPENIHEIPQAMEEPLKIVENEPTIKVIESEDIKIVDAEMQEPPEMEATNEIPQSSDQEMGETDEREEIKPAHKDQTLLDGTHNAPQEEETVTVTNEIPQETEKLENKNETDETVDENRIVEKEPIALEINESNESESEKQSVKEIDQTDIEMNVEVTEEKMTNLEETQKKSPEVIDLEQINDKIEIENESMPIVDEFGNNGEMTVESEEPKIEQILSEVLESPTDLKTDLEGISDVLLVNENENDNDVLESLIIPPTEENYLPTETKNDLDLYVADEVEKAFGNDLPDDMVQKLEIESVLQPVMVAPVEIVENSSFQITSPPIRKPVGFMINKDTDDTLQQAVASIMDIQDEPMQLDLPTSIIEEEKMEIQQTESVTNIITQEDETITQIEEIKPVEEVPTSIIVEEEKVTPEIKEVKTLEDSSLKIADEKELPPLTATVEEKPYSPKVTIKPLKAPEDTQMKLGSKLEEILTKPSTANSVHRLEKPLSIITVDDVEKEKPYSPKVTIKPIKVPEEEESTTNVENENKGSLKMTITKQSNTMHSILKIYNPEDETEPELEQTVPKLIIKPVIAQNEQQQQHSPKMSSRSLKQLYNSPTTSSSQRSGSPRITIKPVIKPQEIKSDVVSPLKITIKPVIKPDENKKHSPKLITKPIIKPDENKKHSPKLTIKPIVKPSEEIEQVHSPRITIKPIQPEIESPKVTIKPIKKPEDAAETIIESPTERPCPKLTIKPIVKPPEPDSSQNMEVGEEEEVKERIVLKINKGNLPTPTKELKKREHEDDKSEKLAKITLKFSKEGGHPHIVQQPENNPNKRSYEEVGTPEKNKRLKVDPEETSIENVPPVTPVVVSEEANPDSSVGITPDDSMKDPCSDIPVFEITPESVTVTNKNLVTTTSPVVQQLPVTPLVTIPPTPRKRGRPRKVPLVVREDFNELPKPEVEVVRRPESTRPKRSCRGQNVRDTLGIKPRKPRGPGRGRGSKRGMGTRTVPMKPVEEQKFSKAKLKLLRESFDDHIPKSSFDLNVNLKSPGSLFALPINSEIKSEVLVPRSSSIDTADIVMFEEETRMSADTSSRAQTPAKQVGITDIEESQSSVQSTATTESGRAVSTRPSKQPKMEIPEPEGSVIAADQLAEYYWSGNGPFMLQEQVAQFLGIKSFKRKYPGISRRFVDMQERDFIRESGLASEAMCDLGLTAVNSADILDIMYTDFQDKYEEYCKHQRDRQAKDLTNKQKALSLAASQEKTKLDITEQAVQSAAAWNLTFNKARREQRKACMDLQTLTVHYPKGKIKEISKNKVGNYPVALVPGQFTDYYQEFTPTELNNLPINTMCYDTINRIYPEDSDDSDDGSDSDSDGSTSSSDSSDSSSGVEDCKLCKPIGVKRIATTK